MATDFEIKDWSGKVAENDLSAKQYYALELGTAADEVDVPDSAGDLVIGILQNDPIAGEECAIRTYGISKWVASANISIGDKVGTTNAGKAVAKTTNRDLYVGVALTAAAGDLEVIEVLMGVPQSLSVA